MRRARQLTTVVAATLWMTGVAVAQQQQPPGAPMVEPSLAPAEPPPPAPPPPPAYAPPVARQPMPQTPDMEVRPEVRSDLDVEARRWGIGFVGLSQVPVGAPAALDITAPAIGLRYWTSPTMGVDIALGFAWAGGSSESAGTSTDKNSIYGVLIQGGLPLALSTHRHVSFQVIPYAAFAYGGTSTGADLTKVDYHGMRFDVGARAGFELFFGFIGIPELALSATVGVQFELRKYSSDAQYGTTASDTTYGFATTVQNNPWDFFAGTVAARYYF
jgi:hypothetical protein